MCVWLYTLHACLTVHFTCVYGYTLYMRASLYTWHLCLTVHLSCVPGCTLYMHAWLYTLNVCLTVHFTCMPHCTLYMRVWLYTLHACLAVHFTCVQISHSNLKTVKQFVWNPICRPVWPIKAADGFVYLNIYFYIPNNAYNTSSMWLKSP